MLEFLRRFLIDLFFYKLNKVVEFLNVELRYYYRVDFDVEIIVGIFIFFLERLKVRGYKWLKEFNLIELNVKVDFKFYSYYVIIFVKN